MIRTQLSTQSLVVVKEHEIRKCERHAEGTVVKRLREWAGVYEGELVCSHHYVGSVETQIRGSLQVLTPSAGRNAGNGAGVWWLWP